MNASLATHHVAIRGRSVCICASRGIVESAATSALPAAVHPPVRGDVSASKSLRCQALAALAPRGVQPQILWCAGLARTFSATKTQMVPDTGLENESGQTAVAALPRDFRRRAPRLLLEGRLLEQLLQLPHVSWRTLLRAVMLLLQHPHRLVGTDLTLLPGVCKKLQLQHFRLVDAAVAVACARPTQNFAAIGVQQRLQMLQQLLPRQRQPQVQALRRQQSMPLLSTFVSDLRDWQVRGAPAHQYAIERFCLAAAIASSNSSTGDALLLLDALGHAAACSVVRVELQQELGLLMLLLVQRLAGGRATERWPLYGSDDSPHVSVLAVYSALSRLPRLDAICGPLLQKQHHLVEVNVRPLVELCRQQQERQQQRPHDSLALLDRLLRDCATELAAEAQVLVKDPERLVACLSAATSVLRRSGCSRPWTEASAAVGSGAVTQAPPSCWSSLETSSSAAAAAQLLETLIPHLATADYAAGEEQEVLLASAVAALPSQWVLKAARQLLAPHLRRTSALRDASPLCGAAASETALLKALEIAAAATAASAAPSVVPAARTRYDATACTRWVLRGADLAARILAQTSASTRALEAEGLESAEASAPSGVADWRFAVTAQAYVSLATMSRAAASVLRSARHRRRTSTAIGASAQQQSSLARSYRHLWVLQRAAKQCVTEAAAASSKPLPSSLLLHVQRAASIPMAGRYNRDAEWAARLVCENGTLGDVAAALRVHAVALSGLRRPSIIKSSAGRAARQQRLEADHPNNLPPSFQALYTHIAQRLEGTKQQLEAVCCPPASTVQHIASLQQFLSHRCKLLLRDEDILSVSNSLLQQNGVSSCFRPSHALRHQIASVCRHVGRAFSEVRAYNEQEQLLRHHTTKQSVGVRTSRHEDRLSMQQELLQKMLHQLGSSARKCLYTVMLQQPVQRKSEIAPCSGETQWVEHQAVKFVEQLQQQQQVDVQVVEEHHPEQQAEARPQLASRQRDLELTAVLNEMRKHCSASWWSGPANGRRWAE